MAIDKANARTQLSDVVTDWGEDFHTLNSYQVSRVVEVAKSCGYRPPKIRNGSPARYFYQFLQRK